MSTPERIRERIAYHERMAARWRRLLDVLSDPDALTTSAPTPQPHAHPPLVVGDDD